MGKLRIKGLTFLSSMVLTLTLISSINVFARVEGDVECIESIRECIRVTLGNTTHIYPGDKKESNPVIQ